MAHKHRLVPRPCMCWHPLGRPPFVATGPSWIAILSMALAANGRLQCAGAGPSRLDAGAISYCLGADSGRMQCIGNGSWSKTPPVETPCQPVLPGGSPGRWPQEGRQHSPAVAASQRVPAQWACEAVPPALAVEPDCWPVPAQWQWAMLAVPLALAVESDSWPRPAPWRVAEEPTSPQALPPQAWPAWLL